MNNLSPHISPFMTRDKADSDSKYIIIDLSRPKGVSVNGWVLKDSCLEIQFQFHFPSVYIVYQLNTLGPVAQIFKVDIIRTICHICVDPGDIDVLGLYDQH